MVNNRTSIGVFNYVPLECFGGGEILAISIFNTLSDKFDITYYSDSTTRYESRISELDVIKLIQFKYKRVSFSKRRLLGFLKLAYPFPTLNKSPNNDLLMIFLPAPPPKFLLKSLKCIDRPVVFLWHGLTFEKYLGNSFSFIIYFRSIIFKSLFKLFFKLLRTQNIYHQVVNYTQYNFLKSIGIKESSIRYIPNGVDCAKYYISRPEKFKVVFMGVTNYFGKGIPLLIKILKRTKNEEIMFNILGSGKIVDKLKNQFVNQSNIEFSGFLSGNRKYESLSKASLMLILSNTESFSLSAVEGLCSGVPIISTNVSGPRTILKQHSSFGSAVKAKPEEVINGIRRYFYDWKNDPISYNEKRKRIKESATSLFGESAMIKSYDSLIELAIGGRKQTVL